MDLWHLTEFGFTPYVLAAVIVLLTLRYLITGATSSAGKLPPGPSGYPFVGVLPQIVGAKKSQYDVFNDWADEYGDVVSVEVMGQRLVFVNDADAVKEILNTQVFSGRPHNFMNEVIAENKGILGTEGNFWKEHRRFQLTTLRDFGMGKQKLERAVQEELKSLVSSIEEKHGQPFHFDKMIVTSVCNIIVALLFDKRYDQDDPKLELLSRIFTENIKLIPLLNNTVSAFPWLRFLPGDMFKYWRVLDNAKMIESMIQDEIDAHKRSYQPDVTRDFVDAFLHRMEDQKNDPDSSFTDIQLLKSCTELFAAGLETTSTTLRWAIIYLLYNPNIQERLHADIDREIGNGSPPSMQDRPNLPYVEATLHEVLRYCCLVPLSLPHCNTEAAQVKGYHIPKRSVVLPNIKKIHFDPKHWVDPEKFDPCRFLSDSKDEVIKKDAYMPFSTGRRSCLGESLAKMELFIFFAGLLQSFNILPAREGKLPSMKSFDGFVLQPEPYEIRAVKRV